MFERDLLLEAMTPASRAAITDAAITRHFDPGEDLIRMGEPVVGVFRLNAGRVRAWRPLPDGRALTLAYVGAGGSIGLLAMARDRGASATVTAVEPVEADLWPLATLRRVLAQDAGFAAGLAAAVADRTMAMIEKLDDSLVPVEQRLGRALLRLAYDQGNWDDDGGAVIAVSRQELADLTGATLFTASRTLSEWQRRGFVQSSRGRVVMTDPGAVADIADLAA